MVALPVRNGSVVCTPTKANAGRGECWCMYCLYHNPRNGIYFLPPTETTLSHPDNELGMKEEREPAQSYIDDGGAKAETQQPPVPF